MKSLKKSFAFVTRKAQQGFTLIELAIVGIFLGLLAVFAISMFANSATDTTKGKSLYEAATKVSDNWGVLAQACGIPTDITSTVVSNDTVATTTARKNLAMLLGSTSASPVAATAYQSCYNNSGIRPLNGTSTGAAGAEKVSGYNISVANTTVGGKNAVAITYAAVPENVVLSMYNSYSSVAGASTATTLPATADTTDSQIRFTVATSGARDVTIVRAL